MFSYVDDMNIYILYKNINMYIKYIKQNNFDVHLK